MLRLLSAIALLLSLLPASARVSAAPSHSVEFEFGRFYQQFRQAEFALQDEAQAKETERLYALHIQSFETADLAKLSTPRLNLLFRAAYLSVFYSQLPAAAEFGRRIGAELGRRGKLDVKTSSSVTQMLVAARLTDEASKWAGQHEKGRPPAFVPKKPGSPVTEWTVSEDGATFTQQDFTFPAGPFVVVVSHPMCHFSSRAADTITQDADISKAMAGRSKWLVPQQMNFYPEKFAEWNRLKPAQRMTLTHLRSEWPQIDSWATPTFYFFRDGALVSTLVGWPREGRLAELKAKLKEVGALD